MDIEQFDKMERVVAVGNSNLFEMTFSYLGTICLLNPKYKTGSYMRSWQGLVISRWKWQFLAVKLPLVVEIKEKNVHQHSEKLDECLLKSTEVFERFKNYYRNY